MSRTSVALVSLLLVSCAVPECEPDRPRALEVAARHVVPPGRTPHRSGALTLLASFELSSDHPGFGGLSGITLSADGETLIAVSDRGRWFEAKLQLGAEGILTGLRGWTVGRLKGLDGAPVSGKDRDAEGLVRDRDGALLVSFEQRHRIWRYRPDFVHARNAEPVPLPREIEGAPANGGVEAFTQLEDRGLVLVSEEFRDAAGDLRAWLVGGEASGRLIYAEGDGFSPTDLAKARNGDLLVLERRYTPDTGARIRIRRTARGEPGSRLTPRTIFTLGAPLRADNFEGLAVRHERDGTTTLYMISDDNFSKSQRTLLYQFRMKE